MQNKGFIRVVAICFIIACLWQLSFSLVSSIYSGKANKAAESVVESVKGSAAFANIPESDQAFYLDSIRKIEARRYTDSI